MQLSKYTIIAITLLCGVSAARAQTADSVRLAQPDTVQPVGPCSNVIELPASMLSDARRSLVRALSVTTLPQQSALFRSASTPVTACAADFPFVARWRPRVSRKLELLPIEASVLRNSSFPRSTNDAAGWHGVGWNLAGSAGVRANLGFLTANIAPEVFYQQNLDYNFVPSTFPGLSEFANPYHADIDLPTRFGGASLTTISPGQSFLQASAGPFAVTAGTENMWIGSADVYPIVLSYTAPGFPHLRIGTRKPLDLKIARLEFQLFGGSVSESDYYDGASDNDSHYFTTTMIVIEPSFVRGLHLGIARAYHDTAHATGQSVGFYLSRLGETPFGNLAGGNRVGNAIGVVLARWVLPESGFEVYAEWSREDTFGDLRDILREPDWTQAYVLGFQKVFAKPSRLIRFYGELIHLGESAPSRAGRGFFSYYTHQTVTQGHTNKGQLLGAAIGPGSDAQLVGLDIFSGSGRSAVRVERIRHDDDTYLRTFARRYGESRHDAEINLTASHLRFLGPLEIEGAFTLVRRYDRDFIALPSGAAELIENNWTTRLTASWRP